MLGELDQYHGSVTGYCYPVPCVARPSVATVLTSQTERVFAFHEEGFQLHASSRYRAIM